MDKKDSSSALMLLQYDSEEEAEQEAPDQPEEKKKSPEKRRHSGGKDRESLSPSRRISEDSYGKPPTGFISDEEIDHHLPDRFRKREHEEEEEETGPTPAKMAMVDVSQKTTPSVSPVEVDGTSYIPSRKKSSRPTMSLVSYATDDLEEDENESEYESEEESSIEKEVEAVNDNSGSSPRLVDADRIQLPPEPPGRCPKALQDKISDLYNRMKNEGFDTNYQIQRLTSFRNPSIYEKLVQMYQINEKGSNFKLEVFNPLIWGKDSFYDELDKSQKKDMERREREKKTKIEFVSGTKKSAPSSDHHRSSSSLSDDKKRKSKWDALPAGLPQMHGSGSNMAALTASATGTRATIISAMGTLTKKAPYSIIHSSSK
ncbi:hypothetical protein ACOMHN_054985 [Nucella lapillus]